MDYHIYFNRELAFDCFTFSISWALLCNHLKGVDAGVLCHIALSSYFANGGKDIDPTCRHHQTSIMHMFPDLVLYSAS